MRRCFVLCFSVALATGCAGSGGGTTADLGVDDDLIVPCQRVGLAALGMSGDALLQALGRPAKAEYADRERTWARYWYTGLSVSVKGSPARVYIIGVEGPRYRTREGVSVGQSEYDVRMKLGAPSKREVVPGGNFVRVDAEYDAGLSLTFTNDRLEMIVLNVNQC